MIAFDGQQKTGRCVMLKKKIKQLIQLFSNRKVSNKSQRWKLNKYYLRFITL